MGFKGIGFIGVAILLVGCSVEDRQTGYRKTKSADNAAVKTSTVKPASTHDPLSLSVPVPVEPPVVQTEEFRKANPDYKPTNYVDIPAGTVFRFRDLTLDSSESMIPKQMHKNNPVVIFITHPQKLNRKPLNLSNVDLKVTKKDGVKVNGRELKENEMLLTYWDSGIQGSDEDKTVKLPITCVYHGQRINPQSKKVERQFLNRSCTIEEFNGILSQQGALTLDYADVPY